MRNREDDVFAACELYAQQDAVLYVDYQLSVPYGSPFGRNDKVIAIDEYGTGFSFLVIQVEDDAGMPLGLAYMAKVDTSESEIPAPETPRGGGRGNSGGGNGGGGSLEWTDPVK